MVGSRTLTALAGIVGSLLISAIVYVYTGSLLFFLVVPFVPFLFGSGGSERAEQPPVRECPQCDFVAHDPQFDYCPRDGSRLREQREY